MRSLSKEDGGGRKMRKEIRIRRRKKAGVLVLAFTLIMIGTFLFAAMKAKHQCTDSDCPYCNCLRQCVRNLELPLVLGTVVTVIVFSLPIREIVTFLYIHVAHPWTLIGLKIRMNN